MDFYLSAPTLEEIIETLPSINRESSPQITKLNDGTYFANMGQGLDYHHAFNKSAVEAAAELWILFNKKEE